MRLLKRKPEPEPEPEPDLAGQILRLRGQVAAFLDAKVMELKSSRDGASVPIDFLRHMLTRGDTCPCRIAMNLLTEDKS